MRYIHPHTGMESHTHVTHHAPLATSEIATLWKTAQYFSMIYYSLQHVHHTCQDPDIRQLLARGLDIVEGRTKMASDLLQAENHRVPVGFSSEDVDMSAPRLYTDEFYLFFLLKAVRLGIGFFGTALSNSIRPDVRAFFTKSLQRDMDYYNAINDLLLAKGLYVRPPAINTIDEVDFVADRSFLAGFLGERRPLLADEVAQLHLVIITNQLGGVFINGFAQVSRSEAVRRYILKGVGLADKVVKTLSAKLTESHLEVPLHSNIYLSGSTTPPYSERLMMALVMSLNTLGVSNFALALSLSPRHDLQYDYTRLTAEAARYYQEGFTLMIDQGWYEEPPRTMDHRKVVNRTQH